MGLGRIVKTYQGKDVIMAAADPYKVKHVEPVLKSSDVLARIFTLAPGGKSTAQRAGLSVNETKQEMTVEAPSL